MFRDESKFSMKVALISDVHANAEALKSVLDDAISHRVSDFWFLGDAVGRGNNPIPILKLIELHMDRAHWVLGNHDAMFRDLVLPGEKNGHETFSVYEANGFRYEATGEILPRNIWKFTIPSAIELIIKNRSETSVYDDVEAFWRSEFHSQKFMPIKIHLSAIDFFLVHGSLGLQSKSDYIEKYIYPWVPVDIQQELEALDRQPGEQGAQKVLCVGHTHIPFMVSGESPGQYEVIKLEPDRVYPINAPLTLINPGSVGQPRDWVPKAAYMIVDLDQKTVVLRKVAYEWEKVAEALIGYDQLRMHLKIATGVSHMPFDWEEHYKKFKEVG